MNTTHEELTLEGLEPIPDTVLAAKATGPTHHITHTQPDLLD
ncbi:hypothetical protein [Streptomyces qinzhouensis]|nr:hypothetical protein [Streptomyces qinzhouensis]